jgi:hypothetical protein
MRGIGPGVPAEYCLFLLLSCNAMNLGSRDSCPRTGSNIKTRDTIFEGVPPTPEKTFQLFVAVKTHTNLRTFSLRSKAGVCYIKTVDCQR